MTRIINDLATMNADRLAATKAHLKRLERIQKTLRLLHDASAHSHSEPGPLLAHLGDLSDIEAEYPEHREALHRLKSETEEKFREQLGQIEYDLRSACEGQDQKLSGVFPTFRVDGYIVVHLDEEKNLATVNGKRCGPISVRSVMAEVKKEWDKIWGSSFNPVEFLENLRNTYSAECSETGIAFGEPVPILSLVKRLKDAPRGTQALFQADLSRLRCPGTLPPDKVHSFELIPVRDPKNAVTLYDRDKNRLLYRGLIRFGREGHREH